MKLFRKYENFSQLIPSIIALCFVLSACSSKKPVEQRMDTEGATPAIPADAADQEMVFEGPGKLLPQKVEGWELSSAPRYFGPDNLYDLINGGAEVFVDYGLQKMVTADYSSKDHAGKTVTAEIYDMGSPKGAFGRLSRFLFEIENPSKAGEGLPEELSTHGIMGSGDAKVWRGPYLLHLTLLDETADATEESISKTGKQVLPAFARSILKDVGEDRTGLEILESFPAEDRIVRTEFWTPGHVMNIQDLGPGFSARYKDKEDEITLFITEELDSEDAAKKAAEKAQGQENTVARAAGKRVVGGSAQDGLKNKALTGKVSALAEAFSTK